LKHGSSADLVFGRSFAPYGVFRKHGRAAHVTALSRTREIRSHLAVALAWGDVDQATVTPALALLDSILAILWRLTHP
jgi:hypothetical protein